MLHVRIIRDPFNLDEYSEHKTETCSLLAFLQDEFPEWPATARLYREIVAVANDITPQTEAEAEELDETVDGVFYVVVYPGDPVTAIVTAVAVIALTAAMLLFLMPRLPKQDNSQSSNNSLGERVNKPRPNERLPDIFGQVISIPELLSVPLRIFENDQELEICYMAVGRGEYEITDIKDGDTPLEQIAGVGCAFYGPNTSPNSGEPFIEIGTPIDRPVQTVVKLNEVNGQTLRPPNSNVVRGEENIRFVWPDQIETNDSELDFTEYFAAGDAVSISALYGDDPFGGDGPAIDLSGSYDVLAVDANSITLSNPSLVNAEWDRLNTAEFPTGATNYEDATISTSSDRWTGPFIVELPDCNQVVCNFVALGGLYKITEKGKQRTESVTVQIEVRPIDADNNPTGPGQVFNTTVIGSAQNKEVKASTLIANLGFTGRAQVRARRTSPTDEDFDGTVVDEVKWRDCYGIAPVAVPHFGDITTVQTRTYATAGATSQKERKFNCRATRKVLQRNGDDTFGPGLVPSTSAADIICHMALDPFIGGRALSELDVPQIYNTVAEVVEYFGFPEAGTFNYTFDQDNISFEEMVQSVAQAVFCTAYRQGEKLRLFFERATEDSTLLFNHRNKVPKSETRTVRFGYLNDHDGVELDYVSPVDGAKLTIYLPADRSATKAKKIEIIGIQDERQGFLHAARAWNKIRYQHTTTEFTALPVASQLVLNERIEVADNTRPDVFDGYITAQDGMTLGLSQPVTPDAGVTYTMFLQLDTGEVETVPVIGGPDKCSAVLQAPLPEALDLDPERAADIAYQIVGNDTARASAFLLTEKGAYDKRTVGVQAINYDQRYYQDDAAYL